MKFFSSLEVNRIYALGTMCLGEFEHKPHEAYLDAPPHTHTHVWLCNYKAMVHPNDFQPIDNIEIILWHLTLNTYSEQI